MELELKILKEKVNDDEKKSGIGSLFDDEKTSHQHILLLKEKYMQMRKDFDKKAYEQDQLKLKITGEQFMLNSQIETYQTHYKELDGNQNEYRDQFEMERSKTDKGLRTTNGDVQ